MNALTKALASSRAVVATAHEAAMRTKAEGGLAEILTPGTMGMFGDSQNSAKYRERYGLFRDWLYSAINAIAEKAAGQAVNLGRFTNVPESENRKRRPSRSKHFLMQRMTKTVHQMSSHRDLEIIEDDPLLKILERPNPLQHRWQFVYSFVANLCLTGWAFIVADEDGEDGLDLYSLPTTWVHSIHKDGAFSKFKIITPGKPANDIELDRSQVAFGHLPNPANPMAALAPAGSQIQSVRINDHIMTSQEALFGNGIFPSVVMTMGKRPFMDSESRPVMQGWQRRQIEGAVNKMWQGSRNYGLPLIVDGMVESVTPFSLKANEMGWDKSEDKVRTRILSAFSVHPFMLGGEIPGSYAQAKIIMDRFCDRVNTYLDMLGTVMTTFTGTIRQDEGLVIWWDKCEARDDAIYWKVVMELWKTGAITQDEIRALAGFPPDEDGNQAYIKQQILGGLFQMLNGKGLGTITSDQVAAVLEGMGLPTSLAKRIAGEPSEAAALGQAAEALEAAVAALRMPPSAIAARLLEDLR